MTPHAGKHNYTLAPTAVPVTTKLYQQGVVREDLIYLTLASLGNQSTMQATNQPNLAPCS
ncbi:hypothetical protein DPMN_178702 [Dreissena polymorpha]|uniref:Uncharacterized protein n=1 Tax=Dreissena polymorpha TaxID=45954 RepID=A0A9D4ILP5_DREPO|nr:hypothetical protein DPMN_178702 [Dreissena polymorpha]